MSDEEDSDSEVKEEFGNISHTHDHDKEEVVDDDDDDDEEDVGECVGDVSFAEIPSGSLELAPRTFRHTASTSSSSPSSLKGWGQTKDDQR